MEDNWLYRTLVLRLDANYQKENDETIEKLQEILDRVGVKIEIEPKKRAAFFSKRDDYMKKKTRNAGRHSVCSNRLISLKELKELIEEKNAETVAKELGISRSTLFRKMKRAKEQNDNYII